jgi:hypothetical protein
MDTILRTRISCSHCDELNDAGMMFCRNCGHCADRPRMACICAQCTGPAVAKRVRSVLRKGKDSQSKEVE